MPAKALLSLLALAILLSSCSKVSINERDIFKPQTHSDYEAASAPENMRLRGEEIFGPIDTTRMENGVALKTRIEQDGTMTIIENGFIRTGKEKIAYTIVSQPNHPEMNNVGTNSIRPLILSCGGNASDRYGTGVSYAQKILPFGDVLMFDYPGYNESTGAASAESFTAMVGVLSEFSTQTAGTDRLLIGWGHSLGGFVCSQIAARTSAMDGLIIETSANTVEEVGAMLVPWYAKLFVRLEIAPSLLGYDNSVALADFKGSVLVMGGKKDDVLPVKLSRSLASALKGNDIDMTYIEFENGGHFNSKSQPGFDEAVAALIGKAIAP